MKFSKLGLFTLLLLSASSVSYAQGTITWTGSLSQAWTTPGNWSPAQVPSASDNVIIPGTSVALHNPTVSSAVKAAGLTLTSGAVLYLENTGTLNVYGDFTNQAGTVSGIGRGTVALVGPVTQLISGPAATSFRNLTIGPAGATTAGPVAVERGLVVRGNLTVGTNQSFTLLSTATGPGYVINAGGKVLGTVSVQRYVDPSLNPGLGYRHLSSPVDNTTFLTLQGPGYTPVFNPAYNTAAYPGQTRPFPTVFGYDQNRITTQPQSTYDDFNKGFYSPAASDRMVPGNGYTVNLPGAANGVSGTGTVVTFTGTLTDGNLSVPVTRGPQATAGWQMLGNPYPSPLDWNKVAPNTSGINTALYVYKSSGQYTGNYSSYVNGVGTNGGTNVLPLAQAYLVLATSNGQVNYTNAQRLSSDSTLLQRVAGQPLEGTRLLLSGSASRCEAVVYFDNGGTTGFDNNLDAPAIPAGVLRLGSVTTSGVAQELTINALPVLGTQDVAVPLTVTTSAAGTYQLARTDGTLPAGYKVFLLDAQANTTTDLSGTAPAQLTLTAGTTPPGRLALLFTKTATPLAAAPAQELIGTTVYPNPATGTVTVVMPQAARTGAGSAELLNALGQLVSRHELSTAASQQLTLGNCPAGIYTLRLTTPAGVVSKRLVIQ